MNGRQAKKTSRMDDYTRSLEQQLANRNIKLQDVVSLLRELDGFLAKAYSAYVHGAAFEAISKPRITMDEVSALQSKIRLVTGEEYE